MIDLDRQAVLEGEPCIKNAHTASQLRVMDN